MYPGFAMKLEPAQAARHVFYDLRPGWTDLVAAGDVLVAGRNFGVGSSRPVAPLLRRLGIAALVADEINSLFLRNAINYGLPAMTVPGVRGVINDGDEITVHLAEGWLTVGNPPHGTAATNGARHPRRRRPAAPADRGRLPAAPQRERDDRIPSRRECAASSCAAAPARDCTSTTPTFPRPGPRPDALLLRVMGSPDILQIDGLGGSRPITSKVAHHHALTPRRRRRRLHIRASRNRPRRCQLRRQLRQHLLRRGPVRRRRGSDRTDRADDQGPDLQHQHPGPDSSPRSRCTTDAHR